MSIKIALAGDINFSAHRGQISGLVKWKKEPRRSIYGRIFKKKLWTLLHTGSKPQMKSILADHYLGNYDSMRKIENIMLEEYGGKNWKNPINEMREYTDISLPFKNIGAFFKNADIGYANLETSLSSNGRHVGMFNSSPMFAKALKENNINIVSIANNHTFDAGEGGFVETLNILNNNNILYVGGGINIDEARAGKIMEIKGIKVGFLAYTSICNCSFLSLAKKDQCGIIPLYDKIVLEDIRTTKEKCDFMIVALHFDIENITKVHKNSVEIARKMIDCGADLIVGNHAHIPKPIELYKNKVIIYCLGSLIFIEKFSAWGNSLVAEIILTDSGEYEKVRFYPLCCQDKDCDSPYIMRNGEGDTLLANIKKMSKKKFNTKMTIDNHYLEVNDFRRGANVY